MLQLKCCKRLFSQFSWGLGVQCLLEYTSEVLNVVCTIPQLGLAAVPVPVGHAG